MSFWLQAVRFPHFFAKNKRNLTACLFYLQITKTFAWEVYNLHFYLYNPLAIFQYSFFILITF